MDCALPMHGYTFSTTAQVQMMAIFKHVSFPRVLPIEHLFFLTTVVILNIGFPSPRVGVMQPAIAAATAILVLGRLDAWRLLRSLIKRLWLVFKCQRFIIIASTTTCNIRL